jgi:hypothetical protein
VVGAVAPPGGLGSGTGRALGSVHLTAGRRCARAADAR